MSVFTIEGLSEEQQKLIQGEIDRRVTEAVQTTTKRVTEEVTANLNGQFELKLTEAVAQAQQQASMSEAEKIDLLTKQLQEQQLAFERSELTHKAESKLYEAGLPQDIVSTLTPLIVSGCKSDTLDGTLSAIIDSHNASINSALELQKQQLAANVTPPSGGADSSFTSQNPNVVANTIMNNTNADPRMAQVQAIQYLLDNTD